MQRFVTPRDSLGVLSEHTFSSTPTVEKVLCRINRATTTYADCAVLATGDVVARAGGTSRKIGTASGTLKLDLVAEGAGSSSGAVRAYVTQGGVRRLWATFENLDFSAGLADNVEAFSATEFTLGTFEATAKGEYEYDSLGPDNLPVGQGYVFVQPNDVSDTDIGHVIDEWYVTPEIERTFAIRCRHQDSPIGTKPFTLTLYDADGNPWLPTGYEGGVYGPSGVTTSSSGWLTEDRFFHYTPPAGFFRARLENRDMTGGTFIYQKPLDAKGRLVTQSARDAKRTELYAPTATFSTTLRGRVPDLRQVAGSFEERRVDLSVAAEIPTGTSITVRYRTSDEEPPLVWSEFTTDPLLVADARYVDVETTLTASTDRTITPEIPPGTPHLLYDTALPHLVRPDRTPLPGGANVVGMTDAYEEPDFETEPRAGHRNPVPVTAEIGRLDGFSVVVFTREARRILKEEFLEGEWFIEDPERDQVLRIGLYEVAEAEEFDSELYRGRGEQIMTTFNVSRAEVLEVSGFYPVREEVPGA